MKNVTHVFSVINTVTPVLKKPLNSNFFTDDSFFPEKRSYLPGSTGSILLRRNAHLKQAAKIAKLGYFEINKTTAEMKWSRQLLDIFELEKGFQFIAGSVAGKYICGDDYPAVLQAFRDAIAGKYRSVSYTIQTGTGKTKMLKTIFSGLSDNRNETFIFGTTQDITDSKEKQIENINREKELRSITESAPVLIIKTNLALEIQYINRNQKKFVGRHLHSLLNAECYEEADNNIKSALVSKKITHFEIKGQLDETPASYRCTVRRVDYAEHETALILILKDITEVKEFEQRMFKAISEAEEKERNRIAAELHDGVCQNLSTINLLTTTLERMLIEKADHPEEFIAGIRELTRDTIAMTRQLSHELMPICPYTINLVSAVRVLLERQGQSDATRYLLEVTGQEKELEQSLSINLYRIIQEFIRNSQKYSGASEISVLMNYGPGKLEITIKDNGRGFNPDENKTKGIGLYTMAKRTESFNGSYLFQAAKGKGVKLQIIIPV